MTLVYILLGLIAIGILLASEKGQELLFLIVALLLITGFGYLVFCLVVFIITLISDKNYRDSIFLVLGLIVITAYLGCEALKIYKKIRRGELSKKTIEKFFVDKWRKDKNGSLLVLISFIFVIIFVIWFVLIGEW